MQKETRFIELIREHAGIIYKIARLYTREAEDVQDLYQDIVYELWKSLDSFRNESKPSTWIYRIAMNTAIRYLSRSKKKVSAVPLDHSAPELTEPADNLDERHTWLFEQIATLGEIDKGIIFLYLEGKNYEEIASITGFTSTNIGTRLGRIRQKLSKKLN